MQQVLGVLRVELPLSWGLGQLPEGAALTCAASRGSDTMASQGQAQELISNHGLITVHFLCPAEFYKW